MANDNNRKTSLEESNADPELKPDATPNATEELNPANDLRSLDLGESGQFAPGGYYNQHGVREAERLDLDEYTATRTPDDKTES
jgi:hypothetical protein